MVVCDEHDNIVELLPKDAKRPNFYKNCAAAALYCLSQNIFQIKMDVAKFDIANDLIPVCIDLGLKVKAYNTVEYVKDMGSPKRHEQVSVAVEKGIPMSRSTKTKRLAIILDRDGTINVESGYVSDLDDLKLINGVGDAIHSINQSKFLALCATNQPVVARGEISFDSLLGIHNKLDTLLGMHGAFLDDLIYCPHHPETGFKGEILV